VATVNIYLDAPKKEGKRPVQLHLFFERTKLKISLGYGLESVFWDANQQQVTRKHPQYIELNNAFYKLKRLAEQALTEAKLKNIPITRKYILEKLGMTKLPEMTIEGVYKRFLKAGQTKQATTIKSYNVMYHSLTAFFEAKNKEMLFSAITTEFLDGWCAYLAKKGNNNITVEKKLKVLQVFLRFAEELDLFDMKIMRKFRFRAHKSSKKIHLTFEELLHIYYFDFQANYLKRVRDFFCFGCFTGLRYQDLNTFTKEQVIDIEGQRVIRIIDHKTRSHLIVPLNEYALSILQRYDYQLPHYSNQVFNRYIKEVCEKAGLDTMVEKVAFVGTQRVNKVLKKSELVTCHTARRTFITLGLERGIPIQVMKELVGHSKLEQTLSYTEVLNKVKINEFNKAWGN